MTIDRKTINIFKILNQIVVTVWTLLALREPDHPVSICQNPGQYCLNRTLHPCVTYIKFQSKPRARFLIIGKAHYQGQHDLLLIHITF